MQAGSDLVVRAFDHFGLGAAALEQEGEQKQGREDRAAGFINSSGFHGAPFTAAQAFSGFFFTHSRRKS